MMDAREERGRVIAAKCSIRPRGALWEVPSQSNNGTYLVNTKRNYCSCPDHAETGFICKHIFAVRFSLSKTEANPDGTATTTTVTVEAKVERKTYKQDWPNYNRAQVNEHRHFQTLLADLCRTLPVPPPQRGQKPNREEYGRHYHQRSNVESTFSAIKRKFGEALRSKTDRAMKNETLAKVVSHNICCVISGMYELGIDPRLAGLPAADGSDDGPRVLRFPVVG